MIPIELDKLRHISLIPSAMEDVEKMCGGQGYISMVSPEKMGETVTRLLLWAGLKHEDPALTPEQVKEIIDVCWQKDKKILFAISKALRQALEADGYYNLGQDADTKNP